jgi:hypothetical protein
MRLLTTLPLLLVLVSTMAFLAGADGGCLTSGGDDESEGEGETGEGEGEGEGEGGGGEGEGEGDAGEGEGEGEGEEAPATCDGVAVSAPCLAVACENDLGVGRPCTDGGGECNEFIPGGAWVCTVDFVPDAALSMCTRPCTDESDCGSGAVCIGDPEDPDSDKGCVPAACNEES